MSAEEVRTLAGATRYGYDANGNQANHTGWAMGYDRENRLVQASSQSSVVSYQYDALGWLTERRVTMNGGVASTNRLDYARQRLPGAKM